MDICNRRPNGEKLKNNKKVTNYMLIGKVSIIRLIAGLSNNPMLDSYSNNKIKVELNLSHYAT